MTIGLTALFCVVMAAGVRPVLARASTAYDEAGRIPGGWTALIFAGVLMSAYPTEEIGVALIFGAFVMGLIMPRHAGLTEDVTRRHRGLRGDPAAAAFLRLHRPAHRRLAARPPELWLITGVVLAVALVGKLFGAAIAARLTGFDWRSSAVIGMLMNTRGMTELIVLNLALENGVISHALFAMLVIMALVTTLITGPMLKGSSTRATSWASARGGAIEAREMSAAEFRPW